MLNRVYKVVAIPSIFLGALLGLLAACGDKEKVSQSGVEETLTSGNLTLLTDNTAQPIVEDVLAVFHSVYPRAAITQVNKTENEIVQALLLDSNAVAVLPRLLTPEEEEHFSRRKITPRITHFASDALALIGNRSSDTLVDLDELLKVIRGEASSKIKTVVFDNPNSSTAQHLFRLAGVNAPPKSGVYAVKTIQEVFKYVQAHPGTIGVVGVNWLFQPPQSLKQDVENVAVLSVKSVKGVQPDKYFKPTQSTIATGDYPLTRKLYLLNYQGSHGLGMGFATYLSARDGQRIILKSGLLPAEIPTREINVPE